MNNIDDLIKKRHSVRKYQDKEIEQKKVEELNKLIDNINKENNLHLQLVLNDSSPFDKFILHYGKLDAKNYLAMIGPSDKKLDEKIGYYGEKIVLKATELGLNTCWVSGTFSKRNVKAKIDNNEKLPCIIAIGYGTSNGVERGSKTFSDVSLSKSTPEWYKKGIEYALLAPTAMNEQKFKFELINDSTVRATPGTGIGNTKLDLGIAKYHFELGAGIDNFKWE